MPLGDTNSWVVNISPDGSVVVGYSQPTDFSSKHPWRLVKGAASPTVIPRPSGKKFCAANAVDSSGAIYGSCEDSSFQYVNGTSSLLDFSPFTAYAKDVSRNGKVIVGYADFEGQQAVQGTGTTSTLIPKLGTDFSGAFATNGDGSVVVGDEYVGTHVRWFWTQSAGTTLQAGAQHLRAVLPGQLKRKRYSFGPRSREAPQMATTRTTFSLSKTT